MRTDSATTCDTWHLSTAELNMNWYCVDTRTPLMGIADARVGAYAQQLHALARLYRDALAMGNTGEALDYVRRGRRFLTRIRYWKQYAAQERGWATATRWRAVSGIRKGRWG